MEQAIEGGSNVLYCLTFQIAWNELTYRVVGDDIRLTDEPPMVEILNKRAARRDNLSEDCYVAMAGLGKDQILGRIDKALKEKFKDSAPKVNLDLGEHGFIAYAYLHKNLKFEKEFEGLETPILFRCNSNETNVKCFGIEKYSYSKHKDLGKQVEILDYKDDSEFIIGLKSISLNDEIILGKIKPGKTLLATVKAVQERAETRRSWPLSKGDTLQIPKFDFDIQHSYSELLGKSLKNKGFTDYFIAEAIQSIRFKLDEKGAVLKSEARVKLTQPVSRSGRPRHFVFDTPFLIYLKEKGAKYPYFAMWVGNAELLVKE